MVSRLSAVLVFFIFLVSSSQAQEIFKLNEVELQKSPNQQQRLYYALNEKAFSDPEFKRGALFEFTTKSGTKEFIVTKRTEYVPGTISIIAAEKGNKDNVFAVTYSNGRLKGKFHETHSETVFLGYESTNSRHYISSNRPKGTKPIECSVHDGDERFTVFPTHNDRQFKNQGPSSRKATSASPAAVDDSVTIDIMIVYTDEAETWASSSEYGDIDGAIAQSLNLSQTALNNSNQRIELRLVHTYKTSYADDESATDAETHLRRFSQNPANPQFGSEANGYMEDVHQLRDQYGADLMALYMSDPNTGGIAWRLGSTSGSPESAFSVNNITQVADTYTLIHEIGHNMGNAHSRNQADQAADDRGGLFHYSAGYRNSQANFHTVMTYGNNITTDAPIFSSPDLTFNGAPAGTDDAVTPENNALSMRQVKRTVASYRPTVVNSPVAELSTQNIEVEMNREDELTISFDVSNTGESSLMWDISFDFAESSVGKTAGKAQQRESMEPVEIDPDLQRPFNYSGAILDQSRSKLLAPEQIYETSFESSEGFEATTYSAISEWRSFTESDFEISTENPADGSQHMRLEYDGKTDPEGNPAVQFMSSPFLGYQPLGTYEVSFSFYLSDINEVYDFYIFDGNTGQFSGGLIIADGVIYAADREEVGTGISFYSTSGSANPNTYYDLRIVFNTDAETVEYYLNGSLISENQFLPNGVTPGIIQPLHRNSVSGAYMDIDNVQVTKIEAPYSWLSTSDLTGITPEGGSSSVELTFSSEGLSAGTYETDLLVSTNDPDRGTLEIPITLNVVDQVSNEPEDKPLQVSLDQNYPNPFNPSTTISYTLAEAQNVELDVFNLQGQKVATIEKGSKAAGRHDIVFDASNLSSGVYIYRLNTAAQTITRKMVLIK